MKERPPPKETGRFGGRPGESGGSSFPSTLSRRSRKRNQILRPFRPQYVDIINETHALLLALLELSLEPASQAKSIRLKLIARGLRRRCNRLAYNLLRKAPKP